MAFLFQAHKMGVNRFRSQLGDRVLHTVSAHRRKPRRLFYAPCLLVLFVGMLSCRPSPQFQQHYNIPDGQWSSAFQLNFQFNISDTAAAYQLFLLIRHTDAYPFSNLWMTMESRGPVDSGFKKLRVEVPLAATSGQWLGRGMGEIWEQRVPINSLQMPAFFPKAGLYTLRLTQDMRRDPLPEVLTIGLRVEKLPPFHKEKE